MAGIPAPAIFAFVRVSDGRLQVIRAPTPGPPQEGLSQEVSWGADGQCGVRSRLRTLNGSGPTANAAAPTQGRFFGQLCVTNKNKRIAIRLANCQGPWTAATTAATLNVSNTISPRRAGRGAGRVEIVLVRPWPTAPALITRRRSDVRLASGRRGATPESNRQQIKSRYRVIGRFTVGLR